MDKKTKLQRILAGLSDNESGLADTFKLIEKEMKSVAIKLREEAQIQTVEEAKKRIRALKLELQNSLESLLNTLLELKSEVNQSEKDLMYNFNQKLDLLRTAMAQLRIADSETTKALSEEINTLRTDIKEIGERKIQIPDFTKNIQNLKSEIEKILLKNQQEENVELEDFNKRMEEFEKDLKKLRGVMSTVGHGGNANRNILVSGNPSTLGRYTDLNLKPGANVTLTYTNNDTLKTTDLTIAATGGAGTSRNISTVSVSSVVAATASTDIVVIASAGILLTMPTAVSNTNLYTIKNSAASSVMVVADGTETIDGSANIILTTQYTAVDLISDSSNWHVT